MGGWYGTHEAGQKAKRSRHGARRRAREKAASTGETPLTLDELYARDNGYCVHCRLPVPRHQASVEHLVPLAKGGKDEPSNQALSCRTCNSRKGDRTSTRRKGLSRTPMRRKPRALPDDLF